MNITKINDEDVDNNNNKSQYKKIHLKNQNAINIYISINTSW